MNQLESDLTVDECVRNLSAGIDPWWKIFGGKPVVGSVSSRGLLARKRLPFFVHNSFQPHISARFEADGDGTRITCRFVLHPFVLAFLAIWFAFLALLGVPMVIASAAALLSSNPPENTWIGVLVPCGMLVFGVALVGGGWLMSSSDKRFLLNFVQKRVQAKTDPS